MDECIYREAAFNAILSLVPKVDDDGYCWVIRGDAARAIDSIPAADVRPVVLCRDCKYSYDSVGDWCCSHGICVDCIVREDFFCADGERADMREES